jgi:hypothetical protein
MIGPVDHQVEAGRSLLHARRSRGRPRIIVSQISIERGESPIETLEAGAAMGMQSGHEASQIPYQTVTTALTRLAEVRPGIEQRCFVDLNPVGKTHWTNKLFVEKTDPVSRPQLTEPCRYAFAQLNPFDNAHNLSSEFLDSLDQFPERQRKRFVEGVFIDEVEDALWTYEQIESSRIAAAVPELARVVVAVDPSGAKSAEDLSSDEIGIVVAGTGRD